MKKIIIPLLMLSASFSYPMEEYLYSLGSPAPIVIASSSSGGADDESFQLALSAQNEHLPNHYAIPESDIESNPVTVTPRPEPMKLPKSISVQNLAPSIASVLHNLRYRHVLAKRVLAEDDEVVLKTESETSEHDPKECKSRLPGCYPCKYCAGNFKYTWGLLEHQRFVCTKSPRYNANTLACSIPGCGHLAKRKSDLSRHEARPHPTNKAKANKKPAIAHHFATRAATKAQGGVTQLLLSQ